LPIFELSMKFILLISVLFCLNPTVFSQDSTNQTDAKGLKQGVWKVYHDNGQLRFKGEFKDNKPQGEFRYFSIDGGHTKTLIFKGDSADARFFHTNKRLMAEGVYFKKLKQGIWKYYDEEGDISLQENYLDNERNGPSRVYYKNGAINRDCSYKKDLMDGLCTDFFENGKKKFEGMYVDGNLDGKVVHYNSNGTTWQSGKYVASVKDGKWLLFKASGELEKIETYKLGRRINTEFPKSDNEKSDSK